MSDQSSEKKIETMNRNEFENYLQRRALGDKIFAKQLLESPKSVISHLTKQELPENLSIAVIQETREQLFLVLRSPETDTRDFEHKQDSDRKTYATKTYKEIAKSQVAIRAK